MTTNAEHESALREAAQELTSAATAQDVRRTWNKHFSILGHRTLGRLLLGRSADELLDRRAARSERD